MSDSKISNESNLDRRPSNIWLVIGLLLDIAGGMLLSHLKFNTNNAFNFFAGMFFVGVVIAAVHIGILPNIIFSPRLSIINTIYRTLIGIVAAFFCSALGYISGMCVGIAVWWLLIIIVLFLHSLLTSIGIDSKTAGIIAGDISIIAVYAIGFAAGAIVTLLSARWVQLLLLNKNVPSRNITIWGGGMAGILAGLILQLATVVLPNGFKPYVFIFATATSGLALMILWLKELSKASQETPHEPSN